MKRTKKKPYKLFRHIQQNDVVLRIYTSFAFVLALTGVLTGIIFMQLYQKNYVESYTKLLTRQGKIISKRVAGFAYNKKALKFQRYNIYIDELEKAEETDMWIMAKKDAKHPLGEQFINADVDDEKLEKETKTALRKAYAGKVGTTSTYDKVYGMTTLSVAVPIKDKTTKEVSGVVMMVSMIDRQTMGVEEGKYLISLSVLVAVIVAYVIAAIFSKYLSKPLGKIGQDISALAGGDYTGIKVKKPHSQIGILEVLLDQLAGELRQSEKQREELEQARRDFFANVSHELRTPITVLRGYTETLNDGIIEEKSQVEDLYQRMLQECQGMERLVEDLFILSKMQNPDFQIEKEPVSLCQIFSDVMRSGRIMGKEKGIHIDITMPPEDPCLIMGDYGRLRQMFMVIIDNAIKFSKENGKIIITVREQEDTYHISIQDFGVGISQERLPYIFEKFYTSKMRQNEKGTGLGLMIAKQIALRHGGDISVESKVGEGTTFSFAFAKCTEIENYV